LQIIESSIHSPTLGNQRRVWLQSPHLNKSPEAICILLDGEYYVERMGIAGAIDGLQSSQLVPPFAMVYVSHRDSETRWKESKCSEQFAHFVGEELTVWIAKRFDCPADHLPTIIGGLSLTGLAAAHAALRCPGRFSGVLCQSASFWWADQWLVNEFQSGDPMSLRFRISCGSLETTEYVEHGPELVQRVSQLASNRAMRDVLLAKGCRVSYEEFPGGHDIAAWKADMPESLIALLAD
jgi:enterochelin esterase-like enzyme